MSDEEKRLANQDENKGKKTQGEISGLDIPAFLREQSSEVLSKSSGRTNSHGLQLVTTLENCRVKFGCNQRWDNLTDQGKEGVRFCSACEEDVHWCNSPDDVIKAKSKGWCVAFKTLEREVLLGKPIGPRKNKSIITRLMVWLRLWK